MVQQLVSWPVLIGSVKPPFHSAVADIVATIAEFQISSAAER